MRLKHLHYGWVIVPISTSILVTNGILIYTFGIFLIPLTMEFSWERGALSGAFSMFMLIAGFLAIFTGRLSDKYGPRVPLTLSGLLIGTGLLLMSQISSLWQVYIIWGLLMGVGGSCCWVPITSTIPRWFAKKRGMAMGLTVTGFGLGGLISPTLAQWLISSFGWPQSYRILGLITLVIVIPLAQFMKHSPQRAGLTPYGEDTVIEEEQSSTPATGGFSFNQAIRTGRFWVLGSVIFCFFFIIQVIIIHLAPYAVDIGISAIIAATFLSIVAATSVLGRLSMGFISDRVGIRRTLTACLVTVTLTLIWFLFAKETWMLYAFVLVFGLAYGGVITLQSLLPAELFGLSSLGIILAIISLCGTTGAALGALLAGSIFDITRSYSLAFLICIALGALAITLSLILLRYKGRIYVAAPTK